MTPSIGSVSDLLVLCPERSRHSINTHSPAFLLPPALDTLQGDELNGGTMTLGFSPLGWRSRGTLGLPPQCTNRAVVIFLIAD